MKNKFAQLALCIAACLTLTACGSSMDRAPSYTSGQSSSDGGFLESVVEEFAMDTTTNTSEVMYMADNYEPMPDFNTEEYEDITENGFRKVSMNPLSTFAIDVDTGSYPNFRRMVNDRAKLDDIPSGAIRIEEMLNYFTYDFTNKSAGDVFSLSYEIGDCSWNEESKLLALTVTANQKNTDEVPNNFVYLIDTSGSMDSDDKIVLAANSFSMLSQSLTEDDIVSIVTYAGDTDTLLDGCRGTETGDIEDALDRAVDFTKLGEGTNGSGGIEAAYDLAEEYFIEGGNNRVIIASDGDMNLGITDTSGLVDLIEEKKESGVFLTTLGFGTGNYSDSNMENIANHGNGNYYYIDCDDEAEYVLVDKLKQSVETVAKDVKIQIEFNPAFVSEYRLLGYENRAMSAEDFEDDTKDGGETGAGQQVTVLYELKLADGTESSSDLKYQGNRELTDTAQESNEIANLAIRYKEPEGDTSTELEFPVYNVEEVTDEFYFVSGLAELSMLLTQSDYAGEATLDSAYDLITENAGDDERREDCGKLVDRLR